MSEINCGCDNTTGSIKMPEHAADCPPKEILDTNPECSDLYDFRCVVNKNLNLPNLDLAPGVRLSALIATIYNILFPTITSPATSISANTFDDNTMTVVIPKFGTPAAKNQILPDFFIIEFYNNVINQPKLATRHVVIANHVDAVTEYKFPISGGDNQPWTVTILAVGVNAVKKFSTVSEY